MKQIICVFTFAGTALFITGLCGLFVANAPVNKNHPQRQAEINRASELLGMSGAAMVLAGFPTLMSSGKEKEQ